ncbi:MAG: N-acetylmuramoyl-L-alanine amidase [Oscillospiraceae bacterium]|nr:N-acetylmuramoyl-L-alanine amidase [Oscillospiraceae bacterium]
MKRFCTSLLALCLILVLSITASGSAAGGLRILVDGTALDTSGAYITDAGVTMIPLRAVMEAMGCGVEWDGDTQTITITTHGVAGVRPAEELPAEAPRYDALIVLDPGHGGSADGASYGGVKEKDLSLSIALQAAKLLEDAGVTVLMTRTDDRDVDLYTRTDLANGQEADLFVSVHCNASVDHDDARGIYTCAYSEDSEGWRLAESLYQTMQEATGAPGFQMEPRPNLAVLRTSKMPAALVECGFMSTAEELALLVQPEYQAKLAKGIADGVLAYLAQS